MSSNDPIDPRDVDPLEHVPVTNSESQDVTAAAETPVDRLRAATAAGGGQEPEVNLWEGSYCAKAMIGKWVAAGAISLVVIVLMYQFKQLRYGNNWKIILLVLGMMWAGLGLLLLYRKVNARYTLTTQRFIHRSGILTRVSDRIEVIDIDDVTFQQGLIERMLDVGSIRIASSDRTHPELWLLGIENVNDVADMIDDLRRKERHRRGLHIESI